MLCSLQGAARCATRNAESSAAVVTYDLWLHPQGPIQAVEMLSGYGKGVPRLKFIMLWKSLSAPRGKVTHPISGVPYPPWKIMSSPEGKFCLVSAKPVLGWHGAIKAGHHLLGLHASQSQSRSKACCYCLSTPVVSAHKSRSGTAAGWCHTE